MKYILVPIFARNVLFSESTEKFFKRMYYTYDTPQVKKYIKSNLRNYIINEYQGKPHEELLDNDPDWVEKALKNNKEVYDVSITSDDMIYYGKLLDYLYTLDPNKVSRISIPQLEKLYKEHKLNKDKETFKDKATKSVVTICEYSNGFRWVELLSRESIVNTGKIMNICLKDEEQRYPEKVNNKEIRLFSLFDSNNKPHIAIEYNLSNKYIDQIKGNSNECVKKEYAPYLYKFINSNKIIIKDIQKSELILNKISKIGNKYIPIIKNIYNEEAQQLFDTGVKVIRGNVIINKPITFPDELTVVGDMEIYAKSYILPNKLSVKGKLFLKNVISLPKELHVYDLLITESRLNFLPDNLFIKNNLDITGLESLKTLPKGLNVSSLFMNGTSIEELPTDLVIRNNLHANNSKLRFLNSKCRIDGSISARNSRLESIENNFICPNNIDLSSCLFLQSIPNNMTVGKDLKLTNCRRLETLGKNLVVGGTLFINGTSIKTVPADAKINKIIGLTQEE